MDLKSRQMYSVWKSLGSERQRNLIPEETSVPYTKGEYGSSQGVLWRRSKHKVNKYKESERPMGN